MDTVDRVGGLFCDMWNRDPTEKSCVYQSTAFKWRCHLFWRSNWNTTMCNSSLSKYVYVERNDCIFSLLQTNIFLLCIRYVLSNTRIPRIFQNVKCIFVIYLSKIPMSSEFRFLDKNVRGNVCVNVDYSFLTMPLDVLGLFFFPHIYIYIHFLLYMWTFTFKECLLYS